MTGHDWLEIGLYFAVLAALTPGLGAYLARVFDEKRKVCVPPLNMLERILYRIGGVNAWEEMSARQYAVNLLWFNGLGLLLLLALQLGQSRLPLNPQKLPDVPFWLALNTAVSFTTNTNWQAYSGETTLGYFVQSLGLTVQNFLSAATGLCVLLAVIRGFTRQTVKTVGNFWSDLVRATV
ncbi:MAG TPA: potassium-transporting ATPase subunit KdpA, partial [bacterium]